MKLNYGFVIDVKKQLILKVNQNKLFLDLIYTKKNIVSFLKKMKFLNQKLIK